MASKGWFDKFKFLYILQFTGEAVSADIKAYFYYQIFNVDETALFWKKICTCLARISCSQAQTF